MPKFDLHARFFTKIPGGRSSRSHAVTLSEDEQAQFDGDKAFMDAISEAAASGDVAPVQAFLDRKQLVNVGNRYYLVAFDLDRDDWRSFRVDRAQNPSPRAGSVSLTV